MKKRIPALFIILLLFFRCFFSGTVHAEEPSVFGLSGSGFDVSDFKDLNVSDIKVGQIFVPASSSTISDYLALQLLLLCCGHTAENTAALYDSADLEILSQSNYDKAPEDSSHTCAFTIGRGDVLQNLLFRKTALIVTVRGTEAGELYSDIDFCPSHSDDACFAENFLYCAEDVFLTLKEYADQADNPLVIICGYSRGAACANLLGVLLDEYLGPERVFVYTFACPTTVRADTLLTDYGNIFNYINPCDLVPRLPMPQWQFVRAGTDILLNCRDQDLAKTEEHYTDVFYKIAPSIRSYYQDRHSLSEPGFNDDGLTSFETMLLFCHSLSEISVSSNTGLFDYKDLSFDQGFLSDTDLENNLFTEGSDLWPLLEIGRELMEEEFRLGKEILHQHLPDIYLGLIKDHLLEE